MNISVFIPLFLGGIKGWQLIILVLLILLLFGAKRIPALMKSLGKSVHSFKEGMAEAEAEIKKPVKTEDKETSEKVSAKDKD